jgi:amino acid transporter
LLLIYAYVGFKSTTIVSGEAINPKRTLPRALVATVIAIGILYFLVVLVYISVLPDADGSATLVDVGRVLAGSAGAIGITLAAFFSIGGNLASIMLAVPRLTFALAEQRLLPRWFGEIHEHHSTPGNSILFLGALGTVFALSGSFIWLAVASSLTRLISYVLCIAALPVIRRQADEKSRAEAYRLKGGYTIPAVALLLCVWIAAQSEPDAWAMTGILLAAGLFLYWLSRQRRARFAMRG